MILKTRYLFSGNRMAMDMGMHTRIRIAERSMHPKQYGKNKPIDAPPIDPFARRYQAGH